jgi:hypothetical protein
MRSTVHKLLFLALLLCLGGPAAAQTYDISSGGLPTITGALGGSITGTSSTTTNLSVTVNFGEISPVNTSGNVKVVVPIAVRSTAAYQVTVSVTGSASASPQGLQATDVGFGVINWRAMGSRSQVCTRSSHIVYSPYNNDPAFTSTISANGRVAYPSTVNNLITVPRVMSGPRLSSTSQASRQTDNGYIFDAVLVITPQFYATGISTGTFTFSISAGPSAQC